MVKLLIVLALCVSAICAVPTNHHGKRIFDPTMNWRVVGGADAKEGQFPYIVYLESWWGQSCGGSIINENWILTAAHCVIGNEPGDFRIVAGSNMLSSGGDRYNVERIIINNGWNWHTLEHDIALIRLSSPISFNDKVQPIPLETEHVEAGAESVLCGWGNVNLGGPAPDKLQFINLKTVSNEQCAAAHEDYPVSEAQVCTLTKSGEGACHGDSGGPLASNGRQIGIVSWGYPCASGRPDVFTRVSVYTSWINDYVLA